MVQHITVADSNFEPATNASQFTIFWGGTGGDVVPVILVAPVILTVNP